MGATHTTRNPTTGLRHSSSPRIRLAAYAYTRPDVQPEPQITRRSRDASSPAAADASGTSSRTQGLEVQSQLLAARSLMPSGVSPSGKTPAGVVRWSRVSYVLPFAGSNW